MNVTKNIVGQVFGRLTVLAKAPNIVGKNREYGAWECLCSCGTTKIVATYHLNRGTVRSCGCLMSESGRALKPGMKINRLTTVSYKKGKWLCQCECGNMVNLSTITITSGNTKSCGCLNDEQRSARAFKLIEGRRMFEPIIASARRVWKRYCYADPDCMGFEDFFQLSQQDCSYCGIVPSKEFNYFDGETAKGSEKAKREGLFIYNGIDRVDNTVAHIRENCTAACFLCNRAKNDRTLLEFYEYIDCLTISDWENYIFPELIDLPIENNYLMTTVKAIFAGDYTDGNLTLQELYTLSQLPCFYCSSERMNFSNYAERDKRSSQKAIDNAAFHYNGLDRVNSELPHNRDNVVPCCYYCNWAKGSLSLLEFQGWITRIKGYTAKNGRSLLFAQG